MASTGDNPCDAELKKDIVGRKLQEREEERLKEISKRKEASDKLSSATESTAYIFEALNTGVGEIRDGISSSGIQSKENLITYFDSLSTKLSVLQKFVTDSAMFLSAYDLAQKQQLLNTLQVEIATARDEFLPKKKFAFKNKKKQTTAAEDKPAPPQADEKVKSVCYDIAANEYRVSSKSNEVVNISANSIEGKDVIVSQMQGCTLNIKGIPSAMHLTDLSNTTVMCGPCARSIFIERCTGCVLVVACQQLRIHEATNSQFFIHVTSKAIIEDSNDLQFGPYQLVYDGIDGHYKKSGLNKQINNWDAVDDFNWLVKDKQSPHWSIMPDSKRVTHNME